MKQTVNKERDMKIVGKIVLFVLTAALIFMLLVVGSAYEDHVRCKNGAVEYCIPADFQ